MKAYIINLNTSAQRRENTLNQLKRDKEINYEFISAIDGRKMTDNEKKKSFNIEKAEKFYARNIKPGEIGCTLSHQKCYKNLLESKLSSAIIFEDDIHFVDSISDKLVLLKDYIDTDIPTVILLSGRFYYTAKRKINGTVLLGKVIDAYLSHAYVINRAAAELAIEDYPWFMADNWKFYIKKGIRIYGIIPHLVDQNREMPSEIMDSSRKFRFKGHFFRIFLRRFWHMLFNIFGHYEKASNATSDFLTQYT